jgi:hypothetical protein
VNNAEVSVIVRLQSTSARRLGSPLSLKPMHNAPSRSDAIERARAGCYRADSVRCRNTAVVPQGDPTTRPPWSRAR